MKALKRSTAGWQFPGTQIIHTSNFSTFANALESGTSLSRLERGTFPREIVYDH